ncbi:MAG: hypothetical protein COU51_03635 [Parcubacteria group bacterium CG10_big_fil_rev_8_21_14_0_10_36_14]|nr:MAG: hypothetical protein COU51_03635 [Parcubacteria group bacterium CG10_big_fil_rev_8_21_14_0_10_36_14]
MKISKGKASIYILLVIALSILFMKYLKEENWVGFYYPDKNNIANKNSVIVQPGLKSIEDCRDWVQKQSEGNENFDYECGYRCSYDKALNITVCKKTEE